jgi:hypothetical protein
VVGHTAHVIFINRGNEETRTINLKTLLFRGGIYQRNLEELWPFRNDLVLHVKFESKSRKAIITHMETGVELELDLKILYLYSNPSTNLNLNTTRKYDGSMKNERLILPAIKLHAEERTKYVVCGSNYPDILCDMEATFDDKSIVHKSIKEFGFITNKGNFYNLSEADMIAFKNDQVLYDGPVKTKDVYSGASLESLYQKH